MAKDSFKVAKSLSIVPRSTEPSSPVNGDIYYDSSLGKFRKYQAGSWSDLNEVPADSPTFTTTVKIPNGSVTVPALAFNSDADGSGTGIYRVGADSLGFSANGAQAGVYDSNGAWTLGPTGGGVAHILRASAVTQQTNTNQAIGHQVLNTTNGTSSRTYYQLNNNSSSSFISKQAVSYTTSNYLTANALAIYDAGVGVNIAASASDGTGTIKFWGGANGATTYGSINANGLWTIGASGGTQTHVVNGVVSQTFPTAGTQARYTVQHTDNTNGSSHAVLRAISGGSSGGDPYVYFGISSTRDWSFGCDNSDSDKFKLSQANALGSNDFFVVDVSGAITLGASGTAQSHTVNGSTSFVDDLKISTAGKGLQIKEGSNAKMGLATLSSGTVVVSTTAVTANSRIFLTSQQDGGSPGFLRVTGRTAGTSFTITSSNNGDSSSVAWLIIEPA